MNQVVTHNKKRYRMRGWAYQMTERFPEEAQADSEWWEYQIEFTEAGTGAAVMEWDSYDETYNGQQRLCREEAETALAQFFTDCREGDLMADLFRER